ncbi:MAG: hypothetical protein JST58_17885 [Bacteroidetes bacterium]|nr:hypothetical protein [Bacteroidota bacterium]
MQEKHHFILYDFLLLILLFGSLPSIAQKEDTWSLFKILNSENGLPQNTVHSLYFDQSTGFLWIGTDGGLVRYNGNNIKQFNQSNQPGLTTPRIYGIYKNTDGKIVVMDKNGAVLELVKDGLLINKNLKLSKVPDTRLLFKIPSKIFLKQNPGFQEKYSFDSTVLAFYFISDSTFIYQTKDSIVVTGNHPFALHLKSEPTEYFKILKITEKKIELLSDYGRLYNINLEKHIVETSRIDLKLAKGERIFVYYSEFNQETYIVHKNRLYVMADEDPTNHLDFLCELPNLPQNIITIYRLAYQKIILVGSLEQGLYMYKQNLAKTYQTEDLSLFVGNKALIPQYSQTNRDQSLDNLYSCSMLDPNHVFTNTGIILDLRDGHFQLSLTKRVRTATNILHRDTIYSAWGYYLQRLALESGSLKNLSPIFFEVTTCQYDSVADKIWLGNRTGGLGYLEDNQFKPFAQNETKSKLIFIKRLKKMLWVHDNKNIWVIDESKKKFIPICSFKSPSLRDLYVDQENNLWISTYGDGIFVYDLNKKKLYHCKADANNFLLFSHYIIEDEKDNFLIPTNNGLFYLSRKNLLETSKDSTKQLYYYYFNKENGLASNEFNGGSNPSYNRLPNGDVLLPSINGLVRLNSNSILPPTRYPIYIEKIKSSTRTLNFEQGLSFNSNERFLRFYLNIAQWEYPSVMGLSYQLDDDTIWTYPQTNEKRIDLLDLSGGNHVLKIRNHFDIEGKISSDIIIHFSIQKKYYEELWFWGLCTLLLAGLIYLILYFRGRHLKNINKQLTEKVANRTEALSDSVNQLEKTVADLDSSHNELLKSNQLNEVISSILAHDIRSPLRFLTLVSEQLHKGVEKYDNASLSDLSNKSRSAIKDLDRFTETFVMWAKTKHMVQGPYRQWFNLLELVMEITNYYDYLIADKENKIVVHIAAGITIHSNKEMVSIMIRNLIDNANKFTSSGEISISAIESKEQLTLNISDTGKGIDMNFVNHLLSPSHDNYNFVAEKSGLGLMVIKDLCKLLHIKLKIGHVPKGNGTSIDLIFEKGNFTNSVS